MTHSPVFLSKKMIKSDSKMDCVYLVRFWGSNHLLDTQMTNFMTGATQKSNKIEKKNYIWGCPVGQQRAGNGTQLPVHVEIHLLIDL